MATGNAAGKGIVLSRLSKSYGQVRAVRSLDLAIAAGETVALLGPTAPARPRRSTWCWA
jgi:ABC-type sugar transport system ATPase subunit